jgi:hypothetical protein
MNQVELEKMLDHARNQYSELLADFVKFAALNPAQTIAGSLTNRLVKAQYKLELLTELLEANRASIEDYERMVKRLRIKLTDHAINHDSTVRHEISTFIQEDLRIFSIADILRVLDY